MDQPGEKQEEEKRRYRAHQQRDGQADDGNGRYDCQHRADRAEADQAHDPEGHQHDVEVAGIETHAGVPVDLQAWSHNPVSRR